MVESNIGVYLVTAVQDFLHPLLPVLLLLLLDRLLDPLVQSLLLQDQLPLLPLFMLSNHPFIQGKHFVTKFKKVGITFCDQESGNNIL